MFGEYAQIASYVQTSREALHHNDLYSPEPMPAYLRPSFTPPHPWNQKKEKNGLGEDFVMVAEFSELEGPKPVMTIPKDGGASFDQNMFAVKILAVDHQHSTEGFTITEDAQVVYSDQELGIFAFVHHLVLFDNTARGFVRPYCIAYITSQQRKIMYFYEEISWQMKKAARYLKYGNRMVFVSDLERHLKDLDHTKGFLLNQVSKMRLKDSDVGDEGQDIRKNAEAELYKGLQTIRQSNLEIKEILSILKPLLSDRRLEARFKVLEERAFQHQSLSGADNLSLQENWYNDLSSLNGLDTRCGSLSEPRLSPLTLFKPREYKPLLVETKKAKRFNSSLRGLHELCSWGAKEGLKKLRCFHEYFKRDLMLLMLDRNESHMRYPGFSAVCHADCMTGNFLSGIYMNGSGSAANFNHEDTWSGASREHWRSVGSIGSFDSLESFKSADSQSLSLVTREDSPSSVRTSDSQVGNKFESAQSSPKRSDFSLLMENEYYSDVDTSQNGKPDGQFDSYQRSTSSSYNATSQSETLERQITPRGPVWNFDAEWPKSELVSDSRKTSECSSSDAACVPRNCVTQVSSSWSINNDGQTSLELSTSSTVECVNNSSTVTPQPEVPGGSGQLLSYNLQMKEDQVTGYASQISHHGPQMRSNRPSDLEQRENQDVLSTLLESTEIESGGPSTNIFQSSNLRPHAPFPGLESSIEDHRISADKPPVSEKPKRSQGSNNSELSADSQLMESNLGLTHHLASLHSTKVRADSDASSVFTEVSSRELYSHLLGPEVISASLKDSGSSHNDALDDGDLCDDYVDIPTSVVASPWRPKCGLLSVGDWINNLGYGRPGFGLTEVFNTYLHMQHVIASLLTGRPVLIAGSAKCEGEVCRLVNALSVFVSAVRRKRQHAVLEWMSKPPRVADLTRLRLMGVCRPDRRYLESFIPAAVRQTCTVMDVERKTIVAPPYHGHFISALMSRRKAFKTDAQLLSFIQWWLMDIMSKTFIFYHSFCLGSSGSIIYSQSAKDQRDSYCGTVSALMAKIGVKDSDCDVIEHLTELAKLSQLEQQAGSLNAGPGHGVLPIPLRLHHKVCQTFRC